MLRDFCRRLVLGSAVVGLLLVPAVASAQATDEDRAGARAAATAGAAAMNESRWSEAADLFTRAESLMHAPTHLLYLARAQAKTGHLVKARENYLKVVRETLAPGAPKAFVDAQAAATTEAAELEARIPTVKVIVEGDGAEGASVTMDGAKMASALTGIPFPIDPGEHKFQARNKDLESEVVTVTCSEGTRQTLTVSLRLSLRTEIAVAPPPPAPEPKAAPEPKPDERGDGSGLRTGAYVAFGAGVAGLAGGTVFLLQNRSKRSQANDLCAGGRCPESKRAEIQSLDKSASSAGTMAIVGYGVGIAGVATGAVLYVLSSSKKTPPTQGRLVPVVTGSADGAYVGVGGKF